MVDVQPTNEKLRRRAVTIVAQATGLAMDQVHQLLAAASYKPKMAIVMAVAGVDAGEARRLWQWLVRVGCLPAIDEAKLTLQTSEYIDLRAFAL